MRNAFTLAALVVLTGCAAHRPIVDMKGVDQAKYETDLKECQQYADEALGIGSGAAIGAVAGAVLGEVLARAGGGMRQRGQIAGAGAVLGGASGAAAGAKQQRQVVQRCLSGRGYNVLN